MAEFEIEPQATAAAVPEPGPQATVAAAPEPAPQATVDAVPEPGPQGAVAPLAPVAPVDPVDPAPGPGADPVHAGEDAPTSSDAAERKRKHEDLDGGGGENGTDKVDAGEATVQEPNGVGGSEEKAVEKAVEKAAEDSGVVAADEVDREKGDVKRQKVDGEVDGLAPDGEKPKQAQSNEVASLMINGQVTIEHGGGKPPEYGHENPAFNLQECVPSDEQHLAVEPPLTSRKIEVPNTRVGVLIGKAGETIRFLQHNTGAKIQIQRDVDADPDTSIRTVELIGTPDGIKKAEQLIKDVMAEADAGGSPALVARGFGISGSEQLELKIPNDKVGMIIGKGGETIKNLQTRSGARIQLIPQHLPEGDSSKERTVRISGNKKQIESATDMIKEVMNQLGPGRPSSLTRPHGYRPHGPSAPRWGGRPPMQQGTGYDYQQRGPYQSQAPPYAPSYGAYAPQQQQQHQPAPRGNFGTGWEQRPTQATPQTGYNYYGQGQGAPPMDVQQSGPPMSAAGVGGPVPSSANYYGQSQTSGYGQQPTPYPQPTPTQPTYGQGYAEPRYDSQTPSTQQVYGQPPVNTQPQYPQQGGGPQSGYPQQSYTRPVYGGPPQVQPQAYGPPTGNQPDPYQGQYQGQNPPQNYSSAAPQQYPYGSGAPQTYGNTPGTQDGYMQQTSGGYPQYATQMTPGYAQPGQAAPAYQQGNQATSYGQYQQPQQQAYGEQPAQAGAAYGYQGAPPTAHAAYGTTTTSGYAAPPAAAGYAQAPANTTGYDQSTATAAAVPPPQSGYAAAPPAGAQAAFAKSLSPQPQQQAAQQAGYVQYDSTQPQVYSHN